MIAATNNSGNYVWTVPNLPSNQCLIKISEVGNPSCFDISNENFTIAPPFITVTSPNGGESWKGCETRNITWTAGGTSTSFKIEYSPNGGSTWMNVINSTTGSAYSWSVPNAGTVQGKIRVSDYNNPNTKDTTDGLFTIIPNTDIIVSTPNGGENWEVGTQKNITWASASTTTSFAVSYSTDNGNSWTSITSYTTSYSYNWTVPNYPSATSFIKVTDYYNTCINDRNDAVFTIAPPTPVIIVTNPSNSGLIRYVGSSANITWTSAYLSSSFVKIEYSINNGISWLPVVAAANNNGIYAWTVPNTLSEACLVKISDYANPSTFDVSDNVFTITPAILLTSPNGSGGNEQMRGCTETTITWVAGGTSYYYKLEYSTNNGTSWTTIQASYYTTAINCSYNWTIPNSPSNQCLVKITDSNNATKYDQSDHVFAITAPLTLTFPNYGGAYQSGTGTAAIWINAQNTCGTGTNSTIFNIQIGDIPGIPETPSGLTTLCQNPGNITYAVQPVQGATSYSWNLTPADAGTVSGNGTSAIISWSADFYGNAFIRVTAQNACGSGLISNPLAIVITPIPAVPGTPTGETNLCFNSSNTIYTTSGSSGAVSYTWQIDPPEAGIITPDGLSVIVNWDNAFSGNVQLKVKAIHLCGESNFSEPLNINLPLPGQPTLPDGAIQVCNNEENTAYVTSAMNALNYQWYLLPPEAGIVTGNANSCMINWNNTFTGNASVTVTASNTCGTGVTSWAKNVTVMSIPAATEIPAGPVNLCQDAPNSQYVINTVPMATSYLWSINPGTAGNLSFSDTNLTTDWNPSFSGNVEIKVKALNSCGLSNESILSGIAIHPFPLQATVPEGPTTVCQGASKTIYSTSGSAYATSYHWYLSPSSAGTISGTGTSAGVDWSPSFSGNVILSVAGINSCSEGIPSPALSITVNPLPGNCITPPGPVSVCQSAEQSVYSITSTTNAESYLWYLIPPGAGNISAEGTTATISWNQTFAGNVQLQVRAVNSCGTGNLSTPLNISVLSLPGQAACPVGDIQICQNSINRSYSTTGAINATYYEWFIAPDEAGVISGTGLIATVDWNENFFGTAYIAVTGKNNCGSGYASDNLSIAIDPLPSTPVQPTGNQEVCQEDTNVMYVSSTSNYASSYAWNLIPPQAGSLFPDGTSVYIDWKSGFSGVAQLSMMGINACGAGNPSPAISVNVFEKPAIPVITQNQNQLISSSPAGNQWYNAQGPITGATSQIFVPESEGIYRVIVTNPHGCYTESDGFYFNFVNVTEAGLQSFKIYPNPNNGIFFIAWSGNVSLLRIQVVSTAGQVISSEKPNCQSGLIKMDVSAFSQSLYLVTIETTKGILIQKIFFE